MANALYGRNRGIRRGTICEIVGTLTSNQHVSPSLVASFFFSRFAFRNSSTLQVAHQGRRFFLGRNKRVQIAAIPVRDGFGGLNEMCFPEIEKQSFIFSRYHFVTPVIRLRLLSYVPSKNRQRISMIAIPGHYLPTCVATGEQNCQRKSDSGPTITAAQRIPFSGPPSSALV